MPIKSVSTPPATDTLFNKKFVDASLNVNVIVAISPAFKEFTLLLTIIVGAVVSAGGIV